MALDISFHFIYCLCFLSSLLSENYWFSEGSENTQNMSVLKGVNMTSFLLQLASWSRNDVIHNHNIWKLATNLTYLWIFLSFSVVLDKAISATNASKGKCHISPAHKLVILITLSYFLIVVIWSQYSVSWITDNHQFLSKNCFQKSS